MLKGVMCMDERDERILKCLDRDARISLTDISKELDIPVTTIKFRIEKMMDEGIIGQFTTLFDPDVLGYQVFSLIRLEIEEFLVDDMESKMIDELSEALGDMPTVQFVGIIDGEMALICVFKSMSDLQDFVSEMESRSGVKKAEFEVFDEVAKGKGIRRAV